MFLRLREPWFVELVRFRPTLALPALGDREDRWCIETRRLDRGSARFRGVYASQCVFRIRVAALGCVEPLSLTRYLHPACGGEERAYAECKTGATVVGESLFSLLD